METTSPFKALQDLQEEEREGCVPPKISIWEQRYNEMIATCAFTAKERDDAKEIAQDAIRCISNAMTNPFYGKHFQTALNQDFTALTLRLKALTSARQ